VHVLVVEDDLKMAALLRRALEREGYAVDVVGSGEEALWAAAELTLDAVVLDVMIPEPDGFEVCRRLRRSGRWMPVLLLTARDAVADRVAGLDAGADDYLVKPFALEELFARLRALLRREPTERPTVLEEQVDETELVQAHTGQGERVLPWAIGESVAAASVLALPVIARRRPSVSRRSATAVVVALALIAGAGAIWSVAEVGHSGAKATWDDVGEEGDD